MIPEGVDINDLAGQLSEDGVAFSNPELAHNVEVNTLIAGQLQSGHAIAVVDVVPDRLADARDIAQELVDATGTPTVIIQTPVNVSMVSPEYSRAAIESAQTTIPSGLGQVELLDQLYGNLDTAGLSTGQWIAFTVTIAAIFAACSFIAFRRAVTPGDSTGQ